MAFNPRLSIGQVLRNSDLTEIFKCGNMGGMRPSKSTNTMVIIADYTKGLYHDKWIGGVLHYTGTGKLGDQSIDKAQNATLAGCATNGVDVHLFEVIDAGEYIYCGRIELVDKPYTEIQTDDNGNPRKVWMFPIRPVPDNDVKKPSMFVFENMEDYKSRGKDVDKKYAELLKKAKKNGKKIIIDPPIEKPDPMPIPKPVIVIPADIVGKQVEHKKYGTGKVLAIEAPAIVILFADGKEKKLVYEVCIKNNLLKISE